MATPLLKHKPVFFNNQVGQHIISSVRSSCSDAVLLYIQWQPPPPFGNFDHFLPYFFGQVEIFWKFLGDFKVL